jgi:hypothetical protein
VEERLGVGLTLTLDLALTLTLTLTLTLSSRDRSPTLASSLPPATPPPGYRLELVLGLGLELLSCEGEGYRAWIGGCGEAEHSPII